jgi:hypothetical protein
LDRQGKKASKEEILESLRKQKNNNLRDYVISTHINVTENGVVSDCRLGKNGNIVFLLQRSNNEYFRVEFQPVGEPSNLGLYNGIVYRNNRIPVDQYQMIDHPRLMKNMIQVSRIDINGEYVKDDQFLVQRSFPFDAINWITMEKDTGLSNSLIQSIPDKKIVSIKGDNVIIEDPNYVMLVKFRGKDQHCIPTAAFNIKDWVYNNEHQFYSCVHDQDYDMHSVLRVVWVNGIHWYCDVGDLSITVRNYKYVSP